MTAADRVQPIVDAVTATRAAHPGVRIDEFGDGSANQWFNRHDRQGLPASRVDRRPARARHPAGRLRRVPRGGPAGRPGAHVVPGRQRAARAGQPPTRTGQLDQLGDAAGRPGRRRRLLHVLPAPRARGAGAREATRRPRCGSRRRPPAGRCWSPGSPSWWPCPGMFLSGHAALRRLRGGRDPGRPRRGGSARSPCCPPCCPCSATTSTSAGCPGWPDAASTGEGSRLWGAILDPSPAASWPSRRSAAIAFLLVLAAPVIGHPHRATELRQAAAGRRQHHAELPPHHDRLPRRSEPGQRGRADARRRQSCRDGSRGATSRPGRSPPVSCTSRSRSPCTPASTCSRSPYRWPATAPTPRRCGRSTALRARRRARDLRAAPRRRGLRRRQPGLLAGLQRPAQASRSCRSSSSCSCWPSC